MSDEDAWRCWDCRSLLDPQWKRCPYCPEPPPPPADFTCPDCGESIVSLHLEIATMKLVQKIGDKRRSGWTWLPTVTTPAHFCAQVP